MGDGESTISPAATSASGGVRAREDSVSTRVLGEFEIRREIGRGGMGTVYEAWQGSLQRVVALKVLAGHVGATPKAVLRFQREARAAAKLHHTHIVPIFAQGDVDGVYFYAMELVNGPSLSHMIAASRVAGGVGDTTVMDAAETVAVGRTRGESGRPSGTSIRSGSPPAHASASGTAKLARHHKGLPHKAEEFTRIASHMADVADALDYAHRQGVVHRDIKPHNLLLGEDGRLRISDFGLARLAEQPGVTMTGEVVGSPLYMSPEQIGGDPEAVDQRTDIYSLGATLYEWLTLAPPYPGETRERVISLILSSEAPAPRGLNPDVPLDLETICLKAIDRDRSKRYQSAAALRDDLRRFLLNVPILARRAGLGTRAAKFVVRHPVACLAAVTVVVAGALSLALYSRQKKVETTTAVAEQAIGETEHLLDLVALLQASPLALKDAATAMAQGMSGGELAGLTGTLTTDFASKLAAMIGTPSAIALRVTGDFLDFLLPDESAFPSIGGATDGELHLREAYRRWKERDFESAITLTESFLSIHTDSFEGRLLHAALSARLGKYDELASDAEAMLQLRGQDPHAYVWRGVANMLLDRVDRSLADATRALDMGGGAQWTRTLRGLAMIQQGRAPEAVTEFNEALKESPDLASARMGRANALMAAGRHREAMPDLNTVLDREPQNVNALVLRGDCHHGLGEYAEAARDFEAAMENAGRLPALLIKYAASLTAQRRGVGAVREAEPRGAKMEPKPVDPDEQPNRAPLLDWFFRR